MTDYGRWRMNEKDFRELQHQHPELYAAEPCASGEWIVRGDGRVRFESMARIAAIDAGYSVRGRDRWLDNVKRFLLDQDSEQITCIHLGSASGVGSLGDRLQPDDPAVRSSILCTIGSVCQASADYCLERARLASKEDLSSNQDLLAPGTAPEQSAVLTSACLGAEISFPRRAKWLRERLAERSWNRNDPHRQCGPDPKTVARILAGKPVRVDVLERLANALSKKFAKVSVLEIPEV